MNTLYNINETKKIIYHVFSNVETHLVGTLLSILSLHQCIRQIERVTSNTCHLQYVTVFESDVTQYMVLNPHHKD